jgi:DNA helicase HerA-like ATPase
MDLGGFRDPLEPQAVALDVVESLWAQRESRTPTLIVVDEAHNLCAAQSRGPVQAALTERLVQIAAEGRKYGLWLLLSTQRPSKIHPQVLSQCDNLMLMRMNSPGDLAELGTVFGFAPEQMLRSSPFFSQGEALFAGGFVPAPMLARMGARITQEGGSDVSVPLA